MSTNRFWGYLTLGGIGLLVVGIALWYLLSSASPQVAASVVAASATVLVAVFSTIVSKQLERQKEIEQEQRKQKAEVYETFLDYWYGVMQPGRRKLTPAEKKKRDDEYYRTVPKKLITWGSESFLKQYADYMKFDAPEEERDIFDFEQLIYEIRTDLGYSNADLTEGDLLRVFLKGVDQGVIERSSKKGKRTQDSSGDNS